MARPADPHARAALIAAARVEFARRGLRGARVEDITQACGLSKGAFYLHFPTKESLFQELVAEFQRLMGERSEQRRLSFDRFVAEEGPIVRRDVARRTARYRRLLELDQAASRATLEVMWDFRDVLGTLVTGCQGTPFEGLIWQIAEAEVLRIAAETGSDQHKGACRTDVPPELFGSLVIGTFLLLGRRMSQLEQKPDLGLWVWAIQTLLHEGASPASEPAVPRPLPEPVSSPDPGRDPAPGPGPSRPRRTAVRSSSQSARTKPNRRTP